MKVVITIIDEGGDKDFEVVSIVRGASTEKLSAVNYLTVLETHAKAVSDMTVAKAKEIAPQRALSDEEIDAYLMQVTLKDIRLQHEGDEILNTIMPGCKAPDNNM